MSLDQVTGLTSAHGKHVQLCYWSGCPSHRQARKLLERILEEIGAADCPAGHRERPPGYGRAFHRIPYALAWDQRINDVAHAYGARVTPDVFAFDGAGKLAYRGAPDANYADPQLEAGWLRTAIDEVLAAKPVALSSTEPVGCSIKWRS